MNTSNLKLSKSNQILIKKMLDEPRYVSIEQALIITKTYQDNPDKPRIIQRALAFKNACEQLKIKIEPEELIVGNRSSGVRAGIVFPESGGLWIKDELATLATRPQDKFFVHKEDIKTFNEVIYPYWKDKTMEYLIKKTHGTELQAIKKVAKINQLDHAQGHISPNTEKWLSKGPHKLLQEAKKYLQNTNTKEQKTYYEATILVLNGAITYMKRYSSLATSLAKTNKEYKNNLLKVAEILDNLTKRPAKTFHEAIQSTWMLNVLLHLESNASSFSPGRLDKTLYPYYLYSQKCGLSNQNALDIIEAMWIKFNQIVYLRNQVSAKYFAGFPIGFNIALGGLDENGNAFENELSYLFLTAQEHIGLPQPNLSVRLNEKTSDELLNKAIQVVSKGSGMPQFFNDQAIVEPLEKLNISHRDALDYAIVGCVEITTSGNNLGWSDSAMFNLNKALELTMNHGIDLLDNKKLCLDFGGLDTYKTYQELEKSYKKVILYFLKKLIPACEIVEKAHKDCLPSPFLSTVIDNCMENGQDVTAGGAKYNFSGIQMIQAANVADSLFALKKLVYQQNKFSGQEVLAALQNNFKGYEAMQQIMENKVAKYGNDISEVDSIANKWADFFSKELSKYKNYRGGLYHTGMYTVSAHVPMGQNVGATPDGRYAKMPLADGGMSPMPGKDLNGPTAVLKSVSRINNSLTTNGGLLNMKFLPEFFKGENAIKKFNLLMRSFVKLEIPHIQFNVVRKEDLLNAKVHPEKYKSLTVRVAGYTAYFVELAPDLQDEIIARTFYEDIN